MKTLLNKVRSYCLKLIGECLIATDRDIEIDVTQPYVGIWIKLTSSLTFGLYLY
jgi:hypothetical protein